MRCEELRQRGPQAPLQQRAHLRCAEVGPQLLAAEQLKQQTSDGVGVGRSSRGHGRSAAQELGGRVSPQTFGCAQAHRAVAHVVGVHAAVLHVVPVWRKNSAAISHAACAELSPVQDLGGATRGEEHVFGGQPVACSAAGVGVDASD